MSTKSENSLYSSSDIDFLTQKINEETTVFGKAYPFGFFVRDKENNIIAGCNGSVIYGVIYTDQLWIHPDHRKKGLGYELMNKVHDFGIKSGCKLATAQTMSFQNTISFYEGMGYKIDFEGSGYIKNSKCIFLKRHL